MKTTEPHGVGACLWAWLTGGIRSEIGGNIYAVCVTLDITEIELWEVISNRRRLRESEVFGLAKITGTPGDSWRDMQNKHIAWEREQ